MLEFSTLGYLTKRLVFTAFRRSKAVAFRRDYGAFGPNFLADVNEGTFSTILVSGGKTYYSQHASEIILAVNDTVSSPPCELSGDALRF